MTRPQAGTDPIDVAVGFAGALRRAGLEVSLTSALLYAEALSVCDVSSRASLYWAGRCALVHRFEDVGVYDAVFGAYWLGKPLGTVSPTTAVSVPVMLQVDDAGDAATDEEEPGRDSDVITVRYSAAETLATKDFADYTDDELDEARRLMERLRFHGPTRPSRRLEATRSCRGRLDVRRTVRAAMRSGGEPIRMHRRMSGRRPRRLVLLRDRGMAILLGLTGSTNLSEIANYIAGLQRGFHQNKLALAAGIAACHDQAHMRRCVDFLRGEVAWLCRQFDRLDIKYLKPETNFVMFETRLRAEDLNKQLLERGFLLRTQTRINLPFGMRVSAGTRETNQAFIRAIEEILSAEST